MSSAIACNISLLLYMFLQYEQYISTPYVNAVGKLVLRALQLPSIQNANKQVILMKNSIIAELPYHE